MFIIVFMNLFLLFCDATSYHEPSKLLVNPTIEDDHHEFELSNIIASSEAYVEEKIDKITDDDRKKITDHHNLYRSNFTYPIPSAADMNYLEYNKTLEWLAKEYLKVCKFEHGRAKGDNTTAISTQNLYVGPDGTYELAMWLWYNEYHDFNMETFECRPTPRGEHEVRCGHYTAMMWGRLRIVGCARRSYCMPRGYKSDILIACHYIPEANFKIRDMILQYFFGKPCTKCGRPDGNLCHNNLCVTKSIIHKYNLDYTCELNCQNCGEPDRKKCRCKCKKGWDYNDCGIPCQDQYMLDPKNEVTPRWKLCPYEVENITSYKCDAEDHYSYFHYYKCRMSCGQCEPISDKDKKKDLCCGGKICNRFSVLDERTCNCRRHCPTFGCLYSHGSHISTSPVHHSSFFVGILVFIFMYFFV